MFRDGLVQHRQVVGVFSDAESAGQAMGRLVLSGFPIAQAFLIDQGLNWANEPGVIAGTSTGLSQGWAVGNLLGGTSGLLLGIGLLTLPGVGQIAWSAAIAFVLLSGGICTAAGGVMGGLIGLGLTSKQAQHYSQQVAEGKILLMIEGTTRDIDRAQQLLEETVV